MTRTSGALGRRGAGGVGGVGGGGVVVLVRGHCMDAAAGLRAALWIILVILGLVRFVAGQSIEFSVKPAEFSNVASPTFQFAVVDGANGTGNPCAAQQCSFQCKLDQGTVQDCSGRTYSASNLSDGAHILTVSGYTPNGTLALAPGTYSWTVDTVPPTASLVTDLMYTHAVNITVDVRFTEDCSGGRVFQCSSAESCDLVVRGPAVVYPSTLVALSPGVSYQVLVGLSTQVSSGKVTLTTSTKICADAAGNRYWRSANSTIVVRFSRIQPTVNLWAPITNSQVVIGDQARTVQATNVTGDLPLYLDFSEPILGTGAELQNLLNSSHGVVFPLARRSRGNSRFAFLLSLNNTGTAAVTVMLPGNSTASRYGVRVLETATVSFLRDIDTPQVLLSTTARAHTRNRLVPVVVQFTRPVFTFNNSGVTLTGGVLRSFREITRTTYALVVYAIESSTVGVSVAGNKFMDVAGNSNAASSTLQVKHYSSTPAVSIALYSFITAGIIGTAVFSGALAISSANLVAAGAIFRGSCIGADASRNLLGMVGHMQVLALTSFLAVSLPVEYYETANGLQWLIPHVSTPWQKNEDVNYTTIFAAANAQTNGTLSDRRNLMSVSDVPTGVDELRLQSLSSACRMMRQWPTQYDNLNCSLYVNEGLATTTYWSGTYFDDSFSRKQEEHASRVQGRRRLGANATQYGAAVTTEEYETYFFNQDANLSRLKDELLARNYTGWSDFWRNIFWLAVVFGSVILLHILLLLFLRWRTKSPLRGALSIPRFELFLLILALPAICQASAFVIRGGTKSGIAVGVILLTIPVVLLLMTILLLVFGIFLGKRVQFKELRPHPQQGGKLLPPPTGTPLSLLIGAGYPGRWTRKEGTSAAFIPRYGILFEDRKGPPRLATTIDDSTSWPRKNTSRSGLRRRTTVHSDDEHDELAVSRAYTALGCFQSAYILMDILRRIVLGVIFGAFLLTDESWTQVSLALAVTAAQFLYLITTKPFQRRFVQLVETISLLCEIGVFIAAMVILAQNRPYETHYGIGIFMLVLLVLSFVAQLANEWFALIRQLLALSSTEKVSPKEGLKAFAIGLVLPLLSRSRWAQLTMAAATTTTTTPPPIPTPPRAPPTQLGVTQSASTSAGQHRTSPLTSPHPDNGVSTHIAITSTKSPIPVVSTAEYWPGEDLQNWARQTSLERRQQETELVANPLVQAEIMPADPTFTKYHHDAPTATVLIKSRQRRARIHSDSLSDIILSDADSQEPTHSRQQSVDFGPALT